MNIIYIPHKFPSHNNYYKYWENSIEFANSIAKRGNNKRNNIKYKVDTLSVEVKENPDSYYYSKTTTVDYFISIKRHEIKPTKKDDNKEKKDDNKEDEKKKEENNDDDKKDEEKKEEEKKEKSWYSFNRLLEEEKDKEKKEETDEMMIYNPIKLESLLYCNISKYEKNLLFNKFIFLPNISLQNITTEILMDNLIVRKSI